MSLNDNGLLGLLTQKMAYLNQRQSVLAENVANANTPKYQAKDLAPFTFGDVLSQQFNIGLVSDNPNHIVPPGMGGGNAKSVKAKSFETLPNGNSVDLEQQMMQVSDTSVSFQTVTGIYKNVMSWFRIAVKGT